MDGRIAKIVCRSSHEELGQNSSLRIFSSARSRFVRPKIQVGMSSPEQLTAIIGIVVFLGGTLGLVLQRFLPESLLSGGPKEMIGAVVGLLTLLCALVMGLLIWTAYGVYAGQNAAIQSLATRVLQVDLVLADYGPDALAERVSVRESLRDTIEEIWHSRESDTNFVANNFEVALTSLRKEEDPLENLHPSTDKQTQDLAAAKAALDAIAQARLQMAFALTSPVSYPLILIVAGWCATLFLGYALTTKSHPMTILPVIVGACAVATAFYLILDLSRPYSGIFNVSPAPLEQVLAVMGKE